MRKNIALLLCVLAVLTQSAGFTVARAVAPALPTFDQSSTGIYFDGDATSTIQVPANTNFEVGHVISEKSGGTHEINNLRPICFACNHSMGSENMIDFVVKYGLYIG
jgi:hypothetical protein